MPSANASLTGHCSLTIFRLPIQWMPKSIRCKFKGEVMNRLKKFFTVTVSSAAVFSAAALLAQQKTVTVEGYVLDSACAFTKNLDKPISRECALSCAKEGSQLVILTKDGSIYWPIDGGMPAKGQNARLTEFA